MSVIFARTSLFAPFDSIKCLPLYLHIIIIIIIIVFGTRNCLNSFYILKLISSSSISCSSSFNVSMNNNLSYYHYQCYYFASNRLCTRIFLYIYCFLVLTL
jgi:hypothetical protein